MMNETFQSIAEEVKALVEEKLGSAREDIQEQINKALLLEAQIEELEKSINEAQLDSSIGLTSIRVVSDELAKRIEELEAVEIYHGQDGADGKDGIDGVDGQDGVDGAIGPAGADGSDGRDGVDGVGVDAPLWAEGVYREGSLVQANHGQYFKAIRDTSSDVNSDDWERVGTAGFRMTGAFDNDRQYTLGDLFIKDFGLFLSDGEQHKLIAGRGPQGKKGERGLPGKDGIGIDGKDGKDGRDGDTFDCIELSGTNLVVVMKDADDQVVTKTVDLSPVLDVAAEVTKSIETKTQKQFVEVWNEQAKNFSQRLQEHLLDQEAIPVSFYRGLWTAGQSYVRGDLVTFGGALYVSRVTTESTPKSVFEVGGDWVQVSAAAGAGGSGGSGGSGDGSGGPILTSQVMLTHPQRYQYKTQEDANKYFGEEIESLNESISNIQDSGYDDTEIKQEIADLKDALDALNDNQLTDEEKKRRITAIWQYRGMLELDDNGKPIADWDALNADGEWGEAELGGWYAHSKEPPNYGRWKIGDADWLWIQPTQMSWDNESESWRGMDTNRMTPKNVGDTFTLDINEINVDVWNGDEIYVWAMPARFEFRVEEIFYPKTPAGNDQSYAPMIRVSHVRDEEHYKFWLPETPLYGDAINGYDLLVDVHPSAINVTTNELYATKEDIEAIDIPEVDLTPVTDRLDDIEEVLPKVPLVIEPVDIGPAKNLIDYAGRPSGSEKPPESDAWIWHLDAGRTGSPANEMKLLIPTDKQNNIDLQAKTIWFKQGDRVQKWNCDFGGWYTGGNCLHINCTSSEGDDLVNGQPFEIYYLNPNATGDDFIDVISRMESKADDRKLQAEIEVLSGQLSTLVKSQEDGEWQYKGELPEVPRKPGEFILATATLTSEMNSVYLQETDLEGITHKFNAPVGSFIEIVDIEEPMDYVLFEVTDEPQGTGLIQIDCKMVKAGNPFELDDRCIIRFFEIGEGLDINELDNRYLQLTGGVMKGDIRFDGPRQIMAIDGDGQSWVQLKIGTETEYVGQYNSDDAIATKKRLKDYVPISGGTMTGALTAPRINVKTTEFGDGVLLVEGKRDNTNNVAARVTFSNSTNANAYGSIEWYATNGSNGQFRFTDKVILKKPSQTNADGFTIKGYIDGSQPNGDLLKVYHNNQAQDAILYKGKQVDTEDHLATTKWVVGKIAAIEMPEVSKPVLSCSFKGKSDISSQYPSADHGFSPMTVNGQSTSQMSETRLIRWKPTEGHWVWGCEGLGKEMGTLTFVRTGGDHVGTFIVEDIVNEYNYLKLLVRPDIAYNQFGSGWDYDVRIDSALREQ